MDSNRVRIKDIAKHLGISVSTVSRAMSEGTSASEETRRRVAAAVKEFGYHPNSEAKALKTGKTQTIGVIVPELNTKYTIQVIRGIQDYCYDRGIKVIMADSNEDPVTERRNVLLMKKFKVDGLVVAECGIQNHDMFKEVMSEGMPMVFYGRIPHKLDVSMVLVDDYAMSFFIVEKMILAGRKRIAYINGPKDIYNSEMRAKGYRDVLAKYNLPVLDELQVEGGLTIEDGERATEKLLSRNAAFDAIFSFTDNLGIGAMKTLMGKGMKIPEDISVAGFAGNELANGVYPKLTTVVPPMFEIGRKCAEVIMQKIKNPSMKNETIIMNATIKLGDSIK